MVVATSIAAVAPALGVTDEDIYSAFRIPLSVPGARAAAMGGTGLALADDAAACRINPARLASITDPEAVLEGRMREFDDSSSASDLIRFDPSINRFAGATFSASASPEGGTAPAFLSFAYPLKLARPLVLGMSRSEALDLSVAARSVNRTTPLSAPEVPSGGDEVLRISQGRLDAELEIYDLAAGWRLTPTFSVGGALVVSRLGLSAETTGLLADPLQFTTIGMTDPRFAGPAAEPLARTTSKGSDTDLGYSFGAYWRPHRSLAVATAYRRGSRFSIPSVSEDLAAGTRDSFANIIRLPDTAAAGVAWTPFTTHPSAGLQSLTIAFELERVKNSDRLEGLREGENVLTRTDFVRRVSYDLPDATEARLGLEYRKSFLTWTLALRGGLYSEHDSRIHLDEISGDVGAFTGQSQAMKDGDFFLEDDTQLHATLGAGARFYNISFDLGIDMADPLTQVVASATYRFR